jgi:GT2 family glycosyltransferase
MTPDRDPLAPIQRTVVAVATKQTPPDLEAFKWQLGLRYLPWHYRLLLNTRAGWSAAANDLLDDAATMEADVVFMDDDAEILPETFERWSEVEPWAEVIGFRLMDGSGSLAIAPGFECNPQDNAFMFGGRPVAAAGVAAYCAVVTASLMVLRASVVADRRVRFPEWGGAHFEDVPYGLSAWLYGHRVAYSPGTALHKIDPQRRVGKTRSADPDFDAGRDRNWRELMAWWEAFDIKGALARGVIPTGSPPLPEGPA